MIVLEEKRHYFGSLKCPELGFRTGVVKYVSMSRAGGSEKDLNEPSREIPGYGVLLAERLNLLFE